jgi:hypothetical protein
LKVGHGYEKIPLRYYLDMIHHSAYSHKRVIISGDALHFGVPTSLISHLQRFGEIQNA